MRLTVAVGLADDVRFAAVVLNLTAVVVRFAAVFGFTVLEADDREVFGEPPLVVLRAEVLDFGFVVLDVFDAAVLAELFDFGLVDRDAAAVVFLFAVFVEDVDAVFLFAEVTFRAPAFDFDFELVDLAVAI
ncbi:MAG: hypothetical protein LC730_03575 [Acidobacteria bacterium]|nr:hypothetical protein [Acidobacteriota bacterium]MCA1608525.1 hypothetical protein [Acidobacteriota bacterium]